MNYLSAMRRKLKKKQDKFISEHEFTSAEELQLSQDELTSAVKSNKVISVMRHEKLQFPTFQFNADGQVYPALQEQLPRLLSSGRSGWDICFWLFTEHVITLTRVAPNAAVLKEVSFEEMLKLGKLAEKLTETYNGRPVDAATSGNSETFAACVEQLLNPDYRKIPEKSVDWKAYIGALRAQ